MAKEQRLIDANKLKEKAEPEEVTGEGIVYVQDIDDMPTVDAVEVVRCRDCLNYKDTMGKDSGKPCGYGRCLHPSGLKAIVFDEFFCPHGERREGE